MSADSPAFAQADAAARYVLKKTKLRPKIALVLDRDWAHLRTSLRRQHEFPTQRFRNSRRQPRLAMPGNSCLGSWKALKLLGCRGECICTKDIRCRTWRFPCAYLREWE